jgi:probable F420-dependent oxidoreductase
MEHDPKLSTSIRTFARSDPGDWDRLIDIASAADQAGIDRLVVPDHVVFGENLEAYGDPKNGGARGGTQPTGPDGVWLDPLITIAFLAGVTKRVHFGTNILLAALRRPAVLSKMVASLDVLSGGRIYLGVGVGWQREEYEAAGLSFEGRGRLLNHTLEVCQTLWRNGSANYESNELSFSRIHQMPKPVRPGGVPIWVSGTVNDRSMDRLVKFGEGWIPWGPDADDIKDGIARMRSAVSARGRDPGSIGVIGTLETNLAEDRKLDLDRIMSTVPDLREAGVSDFRIYLSPPDGRAAATEYYSEVVTVFRSALK